jgi:hypothetical protein
MIRLSLLASAILLPAMLAAQATEPVHSAVVPQPATTLPLKHKALPTTAAITVQDLMTRLYIFADDSMQGREAGTIGNVKGTDYIAREAKKIGLVPAGDNGSYFQTIPFKSRTVDSASVLSVGGTPLTLGTDWVASGTASFAQPALVVVYGGMLGDTRSAIAADSVTGKLVVFSSPKGNNSFRLLRRAGSLLPTAAAVAVIVPDASLSFFRRPATFVDDSTAAARPSSKPTLLVTEAAAAKMFNGAIDAMPVGTQGKQATLDLRMIIKPVEFPARNVVGIIPGSDPKLKGEYVAIGGHNDHVGFNNRPVDHDSLRIYNHIVRPGGAENSRNAATPEQQQQINRMLASWRASHPGSQRLDSISNGADDDGTGSVSVLEIAQKIASLNPHPKRSMLFVWHVGEEKGLLGSAYFTDHPTVPRDSIVAQLNIDMVGRGDAWDMTGLTKSGEEIHGGKNYVQLVGSRRLSTELGDLAEQVNKSGKHGLNFDYNIDANGHPQNIYCRSDHYEYARYGIPIIFFTTGGHSDYHQVTDEPQYIDYAHMARVDNFIEDLAVHVANLDHRVVVDKPKPDPRGACVQ